MESLFILRAPWRNVSAISSGFNVVYHTEYFS